MHTTRRAAAAAFLVLLTLPSIVAAHAELQTATPKDGSTVTGTPQAIVGTYSEAMTPDGSSLVLKGPDGSTVATGGVDPTNTTQMTIANLPDLAPGVYTVDSTTKSAADGDIDRKTWSFTVVAAASSAPASSAPASSAPASAEPSSATPASATPSSAPGSVAASASATATSTPFLGGTGSPAGGGGTDVVVPIVAAIVIVGAAALWFARRGRTAGRP